MVYLTTSKKPSMSSRSLCKILSALLPYSIYENRGKKCIRDICERAKRLGKRRAVLVYEKDEMPYKICTIKLNKEWNWMEPDIMILDIKFLRIPKYIPNEIIIKGEKSEVMKSLFDFEEPESDDVIIMEAKEDVIRFIYNEKEVGVLLRVCYEGGFRG